MNEFTEATADNVGAVDVAASEVLATPEITASTETNTTATPENIVPETHETETQAFAKRLKEKTSETEKALFDKVNATIAKLGGVTPEGNPIQTYEDLQRTLDYQEMQAEAARQNVPVEILSELQSTKSTAQQALDKLSQYERKDALAKEAETLATDPKWGEFYKANEAEIKAVAESANCDLGVAKLLVYDKSGPTKVDEAAIAQKAIQDYINGKQTSYKPVEGSGATPIQVVSKPKSFDEADLNVRKIFSNSQ